MEILLSSAMGMCFGVVDALEIARGISNPRSVTIHGELVHNPKVLSDLRGRGFTMRGEQDRSATPGTPRILLTAHGTSDREKRRLRGMGKELIDTTCPLVHRAHEAARRLEAAGYHVIVIGRKNHVEIRGITGDLTSFSVVESADDAERYAAKKIGILCQTTSVSEEVNAIRRAIRSKNPAARIRFIDTMCQPTKDRQRALDELIPRVDIMIVVGGANSNNTRKLATRCEKSGLPTHHIGEASELRDEWFEGCRRAGLTAGTSTLRETIAEVHRRLLRIASRQLSPSA